MKVYLFAFYALTAVLGHSSEVAARSFTCERIFQQAPETSTSIQIPLKALRQSLLELHTALKSQVLDGDALSPLKNLTEDPRELSYLLQGSYRLLLSHPEVQGILSKKQIQKLENGLSEMKWLEKQLGQYQNSKELVKAGRKISAPSDFLEYLENQRNLLSQKVLAKLQEREFLTDELSVIDTLVSELHSMKKLDRRVSQDFLLKSLRSEIERVQEKVEKEMKPLMLRPSYGFHELENGAHAFRRSLRWLKVYIVAYRDHFTLLPPLRPLNSADAALHDKYLPKDEVQLGLSGSIRLRETEYYTLLDMIAELRKIKGAGEIREDLTLALTDFGRWDGQFVDASQAATLISSRTEAKLQNAESRTQEILALYEKLNSFRNLIDGSSQ